MTQVASRFEEFIAQFRIILPTHTATARAIDQNESWDRIAMKAIDDGYIECADEFVQFVEACVRRST